MEWVCEEKNDRELRAQSTSSLEEDPHSVSFMEAFSVAHQQHE